MADIPEAKVIFDLDRTIGTLVVDWAVWHERIGDLVNEFDAAVIRPSKINYRRQNELIEKYGKNFRDRLAAMNTEFEQELVTDFAPNPNAVDFIKATDKDLYLWSSNSLQTVHKYLGAIGIQDRFQKLVTRDDVHFLKPDPEGFALIHDGSTPLSSYVFVGDSEADEGAAKAAGIRFLHIDGL